MPCWFVVGSSCHDATIFGIFFDCLTNVQFSIYIEFSLSIHRRRQKLKDPGKKIHFLNVYGYKFFGRSFALPDVI
jgi:hypothetical protein